MKIQGERKHEETEEGQTEGMKDWRIEGIQKVKNKIKGRKLIQELLQILSLKVIVKDF
jgi:hypothetical protein